MKGQLRVDKQIRKLPGKLHLFSVRYDRFSANRPENRLIHFALNRVSVWARHPSNQRLAREMLFYFKDIPKSSNPKLDLSYWSTQRDMVHYHSILPWIRFILEDVSPLFSTGKWQGISLLFPMEKLFEDYVTAKLRRQLSHGYQITPQSTSEYLVTHKGKKWFQLKPDILVMRGKERIAILDTKWKLLDSNSDLKKKYNISQSDLYQLFAYGEKYMKGEGELYLIYPAHGDFYQSLPVFEFNDKLRLWAVPFDLRKEELVVGKWCENVYWHKIYSTKAA